MLGKFNTDSGISPVIGVILLVAVTVALVALATVIVFDIGSDVSDTADATVDTDVDTSGEVSAQIVRNENVQDIRVDVSDDGSGESAEGDTVEGVDVGDTVTFDEFEDEEADEVSGTASVVVTLEDGTEEVLTTFSYENVEVDEITELK